MALMGFAQFGVGGSKDIKKVKQSKTFVVLDPEYGEAYNEAVQEAFNKYWKFSKFEFISGPQYARYCKDANNSFFVPFAVLSDAFMANEFPNVGITLGGKCSYESHDMVASANLFTWSKKAYFVEMIRAVQLIQNYLEIGLNANLLEESWSETYQLYNQSHAELRSKTLYIEPEELLEEFREDIEKVKKFYTLPIQFASISETDKLTREQREDAVFHRTIWDIQGIRYHCLIRGKDSKIIYCREAKKKERVQVGKVNLAEFCAIQD